VGVLEVGELGVGFCAGGFAGVEDFGAEFGAGGAEEVGFLYCSISGGAGMWGFLGCWRGGIRFLHRTCSLDPPLPRPD